MSQWSRDFRENDYFLVYCGWYHSPEFAREAQSIFDVLGLRKDRFFFLFNSPLEMRNFDGLGFRGEVVPHNAWLDERLAMRPLPRPKRYRAIYVARRSAFKRHMLAAKVEGLALVAGINHGNSVAPVPLHAYMNDAPLSAEQVCEKINESNCGLLLSEIEGGCFASSEYLLCGIPVVSTPSFGGRDVWYNDYNAIICEPTEDAIAAAVNEFESRPRDPQKIRQMHIDQAKVYRRRFVTILDQILRQSGVVGVDAAEYFSEKFYHKLRTSHAPDFAKIFGAGTAS